MATDISNTASILSYTYMSGTVEKTGGPKSDTVINDYEEPRVGLAKRCTVDSAPTATGVDLGEIITLDYRIANASTVDISYKTVTIQDSILTNPAIEIIPNSESGGTHVGDTVTKVFDPGLVPGDVAAYSIKIKVIAPDAPIELLHAHALATFTTETGISNQATASCNLNYNHAELTLEKQNSPTGTVTIGQEITYTVTIQNAARTAGTVAIRQFTDPIPEHSTFVRIDNDATGTFAYEATPT